MYQYALPWFSALFCKSIGQAPPAPDLEGRLQSLNDCFTRAIYVNVCRSLFEAHKLLFSFLLAIKILQVCVCGCCAHRRSSVQFLRRSVRA